MRGAPQVGFSATILKIRARISLLTGFRPPFGLAREIQLQYSRKPARCHVTTVLGVTRMRGCFAFLRAAKQIFDEYGDIRFVHWHDYERSHIKKYIDRYGVSA